jgi:hypothetical protein
MAPVHTRIEVEPITINFSPFGLIFTAKKFLDAALTVIPQENQADSKWHPVGKYLTCHSVELSLKAFLALKGSKMDSLKKRYSHRIAELLSETENHNLLALVELTDEEKPEIRRAEKYYNGKVFEYPVVVEIVRAYPGDPNGSHLLSAAKKLVDGLYEPCRAAA